MFILCLAPSVCQAESKTGSAYRALKKVEAATQAGVSFGEYARLLTNAAPVLNRLPRSAKKGPLAGALDKAMQHYRRALFAWELSRKAGKQPLRASKGSLAGNLLELYPAANKDVRADPGGGVRVVSGVKRLNLAGLLGVIWAEASKELARARNLLK